MELCMLKSYEVEELKNQRLILTQLFDMAQASFCASELAESEARRAKLASLKLQEELRVRLEMNTEALEIEPTKPELTEEDIRENARADQGDAMAKQAREESDEHETNPGAA